MNTSILGAVYGALVADALALGAHWVYDVKDIMEQFPQYDDFYDPMTTYHGEKKAGDFTHYGDQCLWLLESIALEKEFSISSFSNRWKRYMSSYECYIDGASRQTLHNLNEGKPVLTAGSSSHDLSVVGRMAPLALLYAKDQKALEDAAVLHSMMTHNSVNVLEVTRFFAQLLYLVLQGYTPTNSVIAMSQETQNEEIKNWIKIAFASIEHDTIEAIQSCGQSCSVNGACPGALHLILKYEDDYAEAIRQNVYAGGDSAARGMVVGMILGAYNGLEKIPQNWRDSLNSKDRISHYLGALNEVQ